MDEPIRLLLIEDNEQDAELIRLELESGGFELDWKRVDTEDGVRKMLERRQWDLIISDFAMPRFDGLSAYNIFSEMNLDTPFIFVSGALGEERAVSAMRVGACDYFLKGNLARLNVAVRRELAQAKIRVEHRETEKLAEQERRRLAMAVEASGAGVFEYSVPLGPDTYHSKRWAEILGYRGTELPSHEKFLDWFFEQEHADDLAMMKMSYDQFVDGRTERYVAEGRMRHKKSHWIDVAIFAKAVERDSNNRATHVVGVMLDLTEQRKLEVQLRQSQKMEAVGRLAGGVAHDFNNLLTVILSFGNFVLEELREEDPTHKDMEEVLKAAKRAESLTGQLLAFSRRKPDSPKILNITSLVEDMDRMLKRVVGEDVDVSSALSPDLWNVRIDPGSLEQVIVNLAVNARDAMVDGGTLTIETANTELDEEYGRTHGAEVPPGEYVVLAISDDGAGMDEETQRRIFEPFFTTKEAGEGTGLGLSTCYGIVKQAGGYIWVYSERDKGTTFRIYLPRVMGDSEAVVAGRQPGSSHESATISETILVVEDEEQVRRLAARALVRLGYRVIEASNGEEALLEYEKSTEPIHLVLTDVVMPDIGGKQLVDKLASQSPEMKILYMSGYTADAIVHRGILDPGTHMLQKPFTPNSLAEKVRSVLDE